MTNRNKTMKTDEKQRKNNDNRLKIWKKTMKNDEQQRQNNEK